MAIKKWVLEADTTITNSFKEGLKNRGSYGNTGAADALEVFSLHGQVADVGAGSKEIARILIRPDVLSIREAISNGEVPSPDDDNAPDYYLRLFNAPHPETLPVNFTLDIHQLDEAFEEGSGVDMSNYTDIGAANWIKKEETPSASGVGEIQVIINPNVGESFDIIIDDETTTVTAGADIPTTVTNIINALVAGSQKVNAEAGDEVNAIKITASTAGAAGNYAYSVDSASGNIKTEDFYMRGGDDYTDWVSAMDVDSGPWTTTVGSFLFNEGDEDLILNVTSYVEQEIWDSVNSVLKAEGAVVNNGMLIKIKTENVSKSYYTKKFFARSSEFFFKRPIIEARWNDSLKDSRGKFYAKKPYMSNNLQTVYLYNSVGGDLADLNLPDGFKLYFSLYEEQTFETPVLLDIPGPDANFVEATRVSTGVYQAVAAVDTSADSLYERWYLSTDGEADIIDVQTSEIVVNQPTPQITTKSEKYIFSITNLKPSYSKSEKPRFRLYSRLKDWSPTIYTVASKAIENKIVDNVYYQIFRATDEEVVVDYGIGTAQQNHEHTLLSYDKDGNYFDFDMSLLQSGYMYGIRFATYTNGEIVEHEQAFKFRVD